MIETEALSPHLGVRYHHDWQVGDLAVWDNTGMPHRAVHYDPSSERTLHRTTIAGEEAFA